MQFILQYGDQALKAIEQMLKDPKDDAQSELLEQMLGSEGKRFWLDRKQPDYGNAAECAVRER